MKSLVFMMILTMAAISAGVVYLSVNRDPLGGVPYVDVALEAPPQEEVRAEPEPPKEDTAAVAPAAPDVTLDPALSASAPETAPADGSTLSTTIELPPDSDGAEPLTTTAFPIPEADPAATEVPAADAPATDQ